MYDYKIASHTTVYRLTQQQQRYMLIYGPDTSIPGWIDENPGAEVETVREWKFTNSDMLIVQKHWFLVRVEDDGYPSFLVGEGFCSVS